MYDSKASYKSINWLLKNGTKPEQPLNKRGEQVGYYHPSGANWNYQLTIERVNGEVCVAVSVFGQIKAYKPLHLPEVVEA